MQTQRYSNKQPKGAHLLGQLANLPNRNVVGGILVLALLAFEIFNFDTTRFALNSLLGEETRFWRIQWATILAIAFCSIDFAGLVQLFTPEKGADEPRETWYLMGAWLLGATMNAMMTWWAVSLTLLNHQFGNEVLSRELLLQYVPIFVAGAPVKKGASPGTRSSFADIAATIADYLNVEAPAFGQSFCPEILYLNK